MPTKEFTQLKKNGRVILVGAGPGDPGLITVKGLERIKIADVLVYDRLVDKHLFSEIKEDCEMIYVGKAASDHTMEQDKINELLYLRAKSGKNVVRLKGGDPYVFGRGGEEAEYLAGQGVEVEVVPGITSALAGPAYAGIPLTHRDIASSFHVITAHRKKGEIDTVDYPALARLSGTLVFLMGLSNLEKIQTGLLENGMKKETPVAVISQATTPKQKTVVSTLEGILEAIKKDPVLPPALVVAGDVVNLRESLSFFETLPLFSKNIVVTRARNKKAELSSELCEMGANVIEFPMIRIEKILNTGTLKELLKSFSQFDIVIFTSENGAGIFLDELFSLSCDARIFAGKKICAIGQKTQDALQRYGLCADIMPERGISEGLWEKLSGEISNESRVLLVQAKNGRKYLTEMLEKACKLTVVYPYETLAEDADAGELRDLLKNGEIDAITFTSQSTVTNLLSHISASELKESGVLLFSIGESTTKAIKNYGLCVCLESEKTDVHSLAEAVKRAFMKKE